MKTMGSAATLFLLLATGFWLLALGDPLPRGSDAAAVPTAAPGALASTPHPGADSLVVRRILAEADGLHAPSPDGRLMAFMGRNGDVAVRELETGDVRTLTDDGRLDEGGPFAYGLMFSPDGGLIAHLWVGASGESSLRVVDIETQEVREILPDRESVNWIDLGSWSPDGDVIAVVLYVEDGSRRIASVPVDGDEPTILRSFDWHGPHRLAFSPDGEWLAYDLPRERGSPIHDVHLLARDGSTALPLLEGPTNQRVAGWLPDGGPFFYLSGDRAQSTLKAVAIENGRSVEKPWEVRRDLRDPWPRGFSRDAFFYVQMPERRQAYTAAMDAGARELTGPMTPLDAGRSMDWPMYLAWSPQGDRVAYVAGVEPTNLVVRSLASGAERSMEIPFSVHQSHIEWSPTEDRIAIWGLHEQEGVGIYLIEVSDGSVEPLRRSEQDGPHYSRSRWSPDGSALYAARSADAPWGQPEAEIVRIDLETGAEETVLAAQEVADFAVSPDEGHLAVGRSLGEAGDFQVDLLPLDGGDAHPRELVRIERGDAGGQLSVGLDWTPDGRHLLMGPPWSDEGERSLWIVDRDGAELRELATFRSAGGGAIRPRVHPNGRKVGFVAGENRWEVWALEGLDRVRLAEDADHEVDVDYDEDASRNER